MIQYGLKHIYGCTLVHVYLTAYIHVLTCRHGVRVRYISCIRSYLAQIQSSHFSVSKFANSCVLLQPPAVIKSDTNSWVTPVTVCLSLLAIGGIIGAVVYLLLK